MVSNEPKRYDFPVVRGYCDSTLKNLTENIYPTLNTLEIVDVEKDAYAEISCILKDADEGIRYIVSDLLEEAFIIQEELDRCAACGHEFDD